MLSTWPDGTARSYGNAFDIPASGGAVKLKKRASAGGVLRVNKNTYTRTTQAQHDRTLAIAGKSARHGL